MSRIKIVLLVLAMVFVLVGIFQKEFSAIYQNAVALCLSCIGI